eukprot:2249313-Rhodomonas_salina.3
MAYASTPGVDGNELSEPEAGVGNTAGVTSDTVEEEEGAGVVACAVDVCTMVVVVGLTFELVVVSDCDVVDGELVVSATVVAELVSVHCGSRTSQTHSFAAVLAVQPGSISSRAMQDTAVPVGKVSDSNTAELSKQPAPSWKRKLTMLPAGPVWHCSNPSPRADVATASSNPKIESVAQMLGSSTQE